LHKVCVRFFWYSVRLTLCNAEQLHYRLSYGGPRLYKEYLGVIQLINAGMFLQS